MTSLVGKLSAGFEYWREENEFSCKLFTNGLKKYERTTNQFVSRQNLPAQRLANHTALHPTALIALLELMLMY